MKLLSLIFLISVWFLCMFICAGFLASWVVGDVGAEAFLFIVPTALLQSYALNEVLSWDIKT